jgi:hypothetical protein
VCNRKRYVYILALISLVADGCRSAGSGSLSGGVKSLSFAVHSATFAIVDDIVLPDAAGGKSGGSASVGVLLLSDRKDLCTRSPYQAEGGNNYLVVTLIRNFKSSGSITVDTYPALDANSGRGGLLSGNLTAFAQAKFVAENTRCEDQLSGSFGMSVGGSVVIRSITNSVDGGAVGTYSLLMGPQKDLINGTFAAESCPLLRDAITTSVINGFTSTFILDGMSCASGPF